MHNLCAGEQDEMGGQRGAEATKCGQAAYGYNKIY